MITTLNEAQHEVWAMREDAAADYGLENADELDHTDFVVAACHSIESDEIARELCRMELGYIPSDLEARLGARDYLDGMNEAEIMNHWGGAPFGSAGS